MSETVFENPLLRHYQALLLNVGIFADANGLCYSKKNGTDVQIPTVIENRRLTLPTDQFVSNPDWDNMIVFHPLCESIVRGESEMITWLKDRMANKLNAMLGIMVMDLAELAANGDLQRKLTTDQLSIVQTFGDADDKTVENVANLTESLLRNKGQWVHLYLRHSGKNGDKQTKRFCKVTFPVYKDLVAESAKIQGVNLRVKDRKFLKAVLEYIFDKIEVEDGYSYGSNSEIAPYYHSLINAFGKVGVVMSSRIYLFRKYMDTIANTRVHTDGWIDSFEEAAAAGKFLRNVEFNVGTGGHGTGNDTLGTAQGLSATAKVVEEVAQVDKANAQLQQIPNTGSALQNIITGNGYAAPQQSSLRSLIDQGSNAPSVFGSNPIAGNGGALGGIPRTGVVNTPGLGFGNNFAQQPQQSAFGSNPFAAQQQQQTSVFANAQHSNFNPLSGIPRR